jgi:exodeoxyribonuclease V alpha subunit
VDNLSGSVERITYYNPENGYSVVRLRPEGGDIPRPIQHGLVTVVGNLPELSAGEHLSLQGSWVKHAKHGLQFNVEICEQTLPATVTGIRRYLGSGLIKGIGPRLAENIVDHFGAQTLEVIEEHPERLKEVDNIGPKRTRKIATAWEQQKQVKEIMLFLHSHGVSTNLAIKIYKTYGDQAFEVVKSDPYRLAQDIYGVGFKTADHLAQDLGLPPHHPSRIEAGLVYVLNAMSDEGHVYAPQDILSDRAAELLDVSPDLIPEALERLAREDRIRSELLPILGTKDEAPPGESGLLEVAEPTETYGEPAVYLTPFYFGEVSVAERLRLLSKKGSHLREPSTASFEEIKLSLEQQSAIQTALSHPVSVLTGGPGTGKTTCIQLLITRLESSSKHYALASPTGRAAKRLSEATGRPASTIHRLLGYSPAEGFKHNTRNPLPIDLLVVDEASMLDLLLAHHLLKAVPPEAHLLLVGDVDQLPSVGAGDVLRDVIASGIAPVTRLTEIFRQEAGSDIITNAHRINRGNMPIFSPAPKAGDRSGDFFLFPAEDAIGAADWILDVVCERIPQTFNLESKADIQVLAPMYRGPVGVNALNERLQAALNPSSAKKPEKTLFGQTFRRGDKVMQTQNDYDKDVYNGDIGFVSDLSLVEHSLSVTFDNRQVSYDWSEADQLTLAYAVSVHKAQGSEFPAVVAPVVTQHYLMLQRNLLYTAITRAQQLCVLVGNRRAIGIAVRNDQVSRRYTALDWRLEH